MLAVASLRGEDLLGEAEPALAALAARPGFVRGRLARAVEDPARWLLVTEWTDLGSYRRALSSYDVKLAATALLLRAADSPGAFEVLLDQPGRTG